MRSAARRMEKEFSDRVEEESKGILWQKDTRGSTSTRVRVVYRGSNSDLCAV